MAIYLDLCTPALPDDRIFDRYYQPHLIVVPTTTFQCRLPNDVGFKHMAVIGTPRAQCAQ